MSKLKNHFQKWNRWRRRNANGTFYQILVLFGWYSPSFVHFEETEAFGEMFLKGFEEGLKHPFTFTFKD